MNIEGVKHDSGNGRTLREDEGVAFPKRGHLSSQTLKPAHHVLSVYMDRYGLQRVGESH